MCLANWSLYQITEASSCDTFKEKKDMHIKSHGKVKESAGHLILCVARIFFLFLTFPP